MSESMSVPKLMPSTPLSLLASSRLATLPTMGFGWVPALWSCCGATAGMPLCASPPGAEANGDAARCAGGTLSHGTASTPAGELCRCGDRDSGGGGGTCGTGVALVEAVA
eukprot:364861-Chlamydomonas_euryale.AAC.14